jgi:serine/threonine protein kinase/Tol biopolymer transport system component
VPFSVGAAVGPYRIVSPLGAGGMGEVFLAEDSRLGRKVAIKRIHSRSASSRSERFAQEARAASALQHPNIITIHDVGEVDDEPYIVMEYLEGESLRDMIVRGRIPVREAIDYAASIAAALAAAHTAGIVHRDIKPENVMVLRSGEVKVLDYGLAKLVDNFASDPDGATVSQHGLTASGQIVGTVAYMSPEQAEARVVDSRSDIFSLGVVLYEMLTGEQPFRGKSAVETLHRIVNAGPPGLDDARIPRALKDVVRRALEKNPALRYQHAGDLRLDLLRAKERLSDGESGPAAWPSRPWWWLATAAALVVMAAVAAAFVSRRLSKPSATRAVPLINQVTTDPGYEGEPTFAADGQTIAYVSDRSGNLEIYLKQISGGPDVNLTNHAADDVQPSFSPDGKQIAFVSSRTGPGLSYLGPETALMGGDIWIMPALGGPARKIASGNFPSWSPDGQHLYFTAGRWRQQKIYRVAATGGAPAEIDCRIARSHPFLIAPKVSPDGRWLLFGAVIDTVYVVPAAGGTASEIARGRDAAWGAAGKTIVYSSTAPGRNSSLCRRSFDSETGTVGAEEALTIGTERILQATVSPNGEGIAFASQDVRFNIERVPFDAVAGRTTGPPEPVTRGSELTNFFDLSPDGKSIVYESRSGGKFRLWRVDHGGQPVLLTSERNVDDRFPIWSGDGRAIAVVRRKEEDGKWMLTLVEPDGANPRAVAEVSSNFITWLPHSNSVAWYEERERAVHLLDLATRKSRRLTFEPGVRSTQTFSADGKWLAFLQENENTVTDIRIVPTSGGASRALVETVENDGHPVFDSRGQWMYFSASHKNLYRVPGPAQGWRPAAPQKVTDFAEANLFVDDPQLSPDEKWMYYTRGEFRSDIWVMETGAGTSAEKRPSSPGSP